MGIEDNGPESAYPGPAEPGSEEETYPDIEGEESADQVGNQSDDVDTPDSLPVDEAEEPSPGNSV